MWGPVVHSPPGVPGLHLETRFSRSLRSRTGRTVPVLPCRRSLNSQRPFAGNGSFPRLRPSLHAGRFPTAGTLLPGHTPQAPVLLSCPPVGVLAAPRYADPGCHWPHLTATGHCRSHRATRECRAAPAPGWPWPPAGPGSHSVGRISPWLLLLLPRLQVLLVFSGPFLFPLLP